MDNLDEHAREVLHQAGAGPPPVAYTTKNMEGIVSWWLRNDGFFAQAETLVILSTILFAIQVVYGWRRRCSSSQFMKGSVWVAYTLTPFVATYTLGVISSFIYAGNNNLEALPEDDVVTFFLWSLSLVTALGRTYSMTTYDVDDNKQYARHLIQHAQYVLKIVAVIRLVMALMGFKSTLGWVIASFTLLYWPPSILMTSASMMASSYKDMGSLCLQDYMKKEHLISTQDYDPVTLKGYNYIIFILKSRTRSSANPSPAEVVTVSQVLHPEEEGMIVGTNDDSDDGARLKEVCLSYALFRLLRRRFFGAACPEATVDKTHALVFQGLLSNVEENYNYAYRIIETELGFAYDHFFTTGTPYLGFMIIVSGIGKASIYLLSLALPSLNLAFGENNGMSTDRDLATVVIMLVLLAMELLQLYVYLSSDFARVVVGTLSRIPRRRIPMKFRCFQILRVCKKLPRLFGCWQNKIGQHSLLKDSHKRSITADLMGSLSWIFFDKLLGYPSAFPRGILDPGVKDPDHVPLTDQVKKAVAQTLKSSSNGRLWNNGASTTTSRWNDLAQLPDELFQLGRSHATKLLVWHIATEYCDIAESLDADGVSVPSSNHHVATRLSSYCAYLMAFVPELLLDHHLETTAVFHETRKVALRHLRGVKSPREKYRKLSEYMNDDQPTSQFVGIFNKGIQLGKMLQVEGGFDSPRRWEILAEFWTEMVLYIAPSNNARDHIQHLANGGEFLTHLWALLTHAGILERGPQIAVNMQSDGANLQSHQEQGPAYELYAPGEEEEEENEAGAGGDREADRWAHTHGDGGFPNVPARGSYDAAASSSTNGLEMV